MTGKFSSLAGVRILVGVQSLDRGLRCRRRALARELSSDAGMSTAEYAVGTIAACAFAAVLYKVVTSGAVSHELQQMVTRALHAGG